VVHPLRPVVEPARLVLGGIDLDPASDAFGNSRIKTKDYIDDEGDGLRQPWTVRGLAAVSVFINPPGGKVGNQSQAVLFWRKLMNEREDGHIKHAIWVAFSIEQLQTSQACPISMLEFPLCVPQSRLKFDKTVGKFNSPSHANAIVYVPGTVDHTDVFIEVFSTLVGACR
jgi:hypothetical protein